MHVASPDHAPGAPTPQMRATTLSIPRPRHRRRMLVTMSVLLLAGGSRTACTARAERPESRARGSTAATQTPDFGGGDPLGGHAHGMYDPEDSGWQLWADPEDEGGDLEYVEPYDVDDAELHGPAGGELQEEYEAMLFERSRSHRTQRRGYGQDIASDVISRDAESSPQGPGVRSSADVYKSGHSPVAGGPGRELLMGKRKTCRASKKLRRKLSGITTCNRCTIRTCLPGGRGRCFGTCKKNCKVFNCSSLKRDFRTCKHGSSFFRTETLNASALEPLSSVIVSAPDPYIPCAEIAGRPTGCPAPGTQLTYTDPAGAVYTVKSADCVTDRVPLAECESPFYPFGVCECTIMWTAAGYSDEFRVPCYLFDFDARDLPQTSISPTNSSLTITRYSEHAYEEGGPTYAYNTTLPQRLRDEGQLPEPHVTLEYFRGFSVRADQFTYTPLTDESVDFEPEETEAEDSEGETDEAEVEIDTDAEYYDEVTQAAADEYLDERYLRGYNECWFRCWTEGAGVLGSVEEEYGFDGGYTVYYGGDATCPACNENENVTRPAPGLRVVPSGLGEPYADGE